MSLHSSETERWEMVYRVLGSCVLVQCVLLGRGMEIWKQASANAGWL